MHTTPSAHPRQARRGRFLGLCLAAWRSLATAGPLVHTVEFDLPAGPLGTTLLGIGRSAGTLVSFKPGLVSPHQAPALQGQFTLQQALRQVLAPSGLSFQITPSGVVTVVARTGLEP